MDKNLVCNSAHVNLITLVIYLYNFLCLVYFILNTRCKICNHNNNNNNNLYLILLTTMVFSIYLPFKKQYHDHFIEKLFGGTFTKIIQGYNNLVFDHI